MTPTHLNSLEVHRVCRKRKWAEKGTMYRNRQLGLRPESVCSNGRGRCECPKVQTNPEPGHAAETKRWQYGNVLSKNGGKEFRH